MYGAYMPWCVANIFFCRRASSLVAFAISAINSFHTPFAMYFPIIRSGGVHTPGSVLVNSSLVERLGKDGVIFEVVPEVAP